MNSRIPFEPTDLVAIEREARRLQALALANGIRNGFQWLRARLSGAASTTPARTA